ncbi:hypothetical protein [Caulobacter sp.]|uniref:hypothetical protein n=1 Tax=Caulobacter sp. TaxID=78 RepID=UPI003BB0858F
MAAAAKKTTLDLGSIPTRTEDEIELTDIERYTLAQAQALVAVEDGKRVPGRDLIRARRLRQTVAKSIARQREQRSVDAGLVESADVAGRQGLALVRAGGYVRLPKGDGVLRLFQLERLTRPQVQAAVAYRELFHCVGSSGIRLSTDERTGGGGLPGAGAVAALARPFMDARKLAIIRAAVAGLDTGDTTPHADLLYGVVHHGEHLRHVVGAGKYWAVGLGRLRKVLDLIHRLLGLGVLTPGER